jgi:DNA-binding SARP family transcriptional activator
MDFMVLGTLQLQRRQGDRVRLPSDAQRRLVSLLVLHAEAVVRAEELGDRLGLSASALRTSVCRLRRRLGADVVTTEPPGYALHCDHLDVTGFERGLRAARSGSDDPACRRAFLEQALRLWRGEPYAEFAHEAWVEGEVRRLTELHCGAVEDLVELEIRAGEWSPAIARLQPLIDDQPFRDRPRGLLMQALASGGRQADALRAFQDYRDLLRDEVGTEPSAPLVDLDRAISRGVLSAPPGQTERVSTDVPSVQRARVQTRSESRFR